MAVSNSYDFELPLRPARPLRPTGVRPLTAGINRRRRRRSRRGGGQRRMTAARPKSPSFRYRKSNNELRPASDGGPPDGADNGRDGWHEGEEFLRPLRARGRRTTSYASTKRPFFTLANLLSGIIQVHLFAITPKHHRFTLANLPFRIIQIRLFTWAPNHHYRFLGQQSAISECRCHTRDYSRKSSFETVTFTCDTCS